MASDSSALGFFGGLTGGLAEGFRSMLPLLLQKNKQEHEEKFRLEALKFKQESEEWDRVLDLMGLAKDELELTLRTFADPTTGVAPDAVRRRAIKQYDSRTKKAAEGNPRVAAMFASDLRDKGLDDPLLDDILGKKEEKKTNTVFREDLFGKEEKLTPGAKRMSARHQMRKGIDVAGKAGKDVASIVSSATSPTHPANLLKFLDNLAPKDPSLKTLTEDERINSKLRQSIKEASPLFVLELLEEHGIRTKFTIGETVLGDEEIEKVIKQIKAKGKDNMTVIFRGLKQISHSSPGSPIVG